MNDYIGATGNFPINDYIDYTSNINFIYTSNTSNYLNKRIDDIDIETSNISSNISSNYTYILSSNTYHINKTNPDCLINYNYDDYIQYGAVHTNIFINSNANSKLIFRSRFNNQALPHKTEIRSDGKIYIYIDGNLFPPILPGWYCLNDEIENIFISNTNQDAAITTIQGEIIELQSLTLAMDTKLQALTILDTATGSYTIISTNLNNFALWQYLTFGIVASIGVASTYSLVTANRAGNLADAINISYVSSNALNEILANNNLNQNEKNILSNQIKEIRTSNNYAILSNFIELGQNTGFINCNITTKQFIPNFWTNSPLGIQNSAPIGTLCVGNSSIVGSDGSIVIGKCTAVLTTRHFKLGIDGNYNFCIGDFGANNTAGTWLNTQFGINYGTGNVGIGIAPSTFKLNVNGTLNCSGNFTGGGNDNIIANNTNGGVNFKVRNTSVGVNAYTGIGAFNDINAFAGIFLNSSTRTADGGVNNATLRNDAGDLRLSAKSDNPYIYLKNSSGNVGIGTAIPAFKLDVNGAINSTDYRFNNNSLFQYAPANSPSFTNGTQTQINANDYYIQFTQNGTLTIPTNITCDCLVVGAGGRGGLGSLSGGGGAGEVIYYPSLSLFSGIYNIEIGVDSSTAANRISKIKLGTTEIITALGGGNGGYWNNQLDIERRFPSKAYNSVSARVSTTLNGQPCFQTTMTLNTTDITYGSGVYDVWTSSLNDTTGTFEGHFCFNYVSVATSGQWASVINGYSTTSPFAFIGTKYFLESTYKGEWVAIKMPAAIALTSYSITAVNSTAGLGRAPKAFKIYASNDGINWVILQTITNAIYTSTIYTDTGLSGNTTLYLYYAIAINQVTNSSSTGLTQIAEWVINGKLVLLTSSTTGGSGGGSYLNVNNQSPAGTPFNVTYSKLTSGYNGTSTNGGSGGSALITGRYETNITGGLTYYGGGGIGATSSSTPIIRTNYGDGGDGNGGLGFQGIIIFRFSAFYITKFLEYTDWTRLFNINIGDGLTLGANNQISSVWTKTGNNIYNNNSGNVGINTLTILEKSHIGGNKILLGNESDHFKFSHDGSIATLNIGGANKFSIKIDYPPDFTNYNSILYYDVITILGDGSFFVGIQKNNPICELDVNGDINMSGDLKQNGIPFISSQWTTSGTSIYYNGGNVGLGDTNPISKLTIKSTYDVVNSGLCINANDSTVAEKYMLKLYPYVVDTGKVGYKFRVINQPSSVTYDALWFRHDGLLNIPAFLGIGNIRQPLTTLDVQGTIACINSATWDHLRFFHDGTAAYFDAGGAENGIVFRIDNTASGYPAPSYPEKMRISAAGNVGINNDVPLAKGTDTILSIGKVTQTNCCGRVVIAQNTGGGSQRKGSLHYDANYNLCLGDYGFNNSGADAITSQFLLYYQSPADTIETFANGNVNIYGNLYQGSDHSYKTDINTIENALWKVNQLRGIEYTHVIEGGDRKLGLIAQEVEYILPEAVSETSKGNKCVSYTEIVPVLINAIKELTERLQIAEAILKRNNLF